MPLATAILREPEVARWWGDHDDERVRRDLLDGPETASFAVEVEGELVGVVLYSEEDEPDYRHAGMDIALSAAQHGRGLGAETLRVLATSSRRAATTARRSTVPQRTSARSAATSVSACATSGSCAGTSGVSTAPGATACSWTARKMSSHQGVCKMAAKSRFTGAGAVLGPSVRPSR